MITKAFIEELRIILENDMFPHYDDNGSYPESSIMGLGTDANVPIKRFNAFYGGLFKPLLESAIIDCGGSLETDLHWTFFNELGHLAIDIDCKKSTFPALTEVNGTKTSAFVDFDSLKARGYLGDLPNQFTNAYRYIIQSIISFPAHSKSCIKVYDFVDETGRTLYPDEAMGKLNLPWKNNLMTNAPVSLLIGYNFNLPGANMYVPFIVNPLFPGQDLISFMDSQYHKEGERATESYPEFVEKMKETAFHLSSSQSPFEGIMKFYSSSLPLLWMAAAANNLPYGGLIQKKK
ncbi:MAG: hypothetical protein NDI94_06175 [Candidatus Woesearchaeota archaeon]|nr:hypothetical protein [Candidatus Woesearchaeota archaeon]